MPIATSVTTMHACAVCTTKARSFKTNSSSESTEVDKVVRIGRWTFAQASTSLADHRRECQSRAKYASRALDRLIDMSIRPRQALIYCLPDVRNASPRSGIRASYRLCHVNYPCIPPMYNDGRAKSITGDRRVMNR